MNWITIVEGAVPFLTGLVALWLGYRSKPTRNYHHLVRHFRWVGPLLMIWGLFLASGVTNASSKPSADEMARQIASRLAPPVKIDPVTTLTEVSGSGDELRYSFALSESLAAFGGREHAYSALLKQACSAPNRAEVAKSYEVHMIYSFTDSQTIDVAPTDRACS